MNRYETCSGLKDKAKDALEGKWGSACLFSFVMSAIVFLFALCGAVFIVIGEAIVFGGETTVVSVIIEYILVNSLTAVANVLKAGSALFFLNLVCGRNHSISNLFYCFSGCGFGKCLAIGVACIAPQFVLMLPYEILEYLFTSTENFTIGIASIVVGFIGICIYLPITYALSMSFYLMLDFPQYSAAEILRLSMKITKGHKRRLFLLDLSLLPMYLLAYCSCGLGFIWLIPFSNVLYAVFFLDLMKPRDEMFSEANQPYDPFAN